MPTFPKSSSLIVVALAAAQLAAPAAAQVQRPDTAQPPAPPEKLFTDRDARIAAAFALGTVLMFPVDKHFAQLSQDEDQQANRIINGTATSVEMIESPGAYVIGGGLYL